MVAAQLDNCESLCKTRFTLPSSGYFTSFHDITVRVANEIPAVILCLEYA